MNRDASHVIAVDVAVYSIATVSRLTGMHPQTLRKYERAGLLRPARLEGNQRIYSENDVTRLRRIQYLVDQRGLNIAGLAMILAMTDGLGAVLKNADADDLRTAIAVAIELTTQ
jgi:DNA-binding transcriptional MerR regulator